MPLRTLLHERDRDVLRARLARLAPGSRPSWGSLDAHRMLCHIADALRLATGEVVAASLGKRAFQRFPLKHLLLHLLPIPRNVRTVPELLVAQPADFDDDRQRVIALLLRIGAGPTTGPGPEHPLFGLLSRAQWCRLAYRHVDHHLRQFGV
jgi:hypothetical protein